MKLNNDETFNYLKMLQEQNPEIKESIHQLMRSYLRGKLPPAAVAQLEEITGLRYINEDNFELVTDKRLGG